MSIQSSSRERGFSIIEILIAVALLSVVTAAVMTLFQNMNGLQRNMRYRTQADAISEEVRSLLSSRVGCINSFGGTALNAGTDVDFPDIKDNAPAPGAVAYDKATTYGDGTLRFQNIRLFQYRDDPGATNGGFATLSLNFIQQGEGTGPVAVNRTINIKTEKNAAGNLIFCVALSKMSDNIWTRTPANANNIYFGSANTLAPAPATSNLVGIGTDAPIANLHVEGPNAFFQLQSGRSDGIGADTHYVLSRGTPTAPTAVQNQDRIFTLGGYAYDGASYNLIGAISVIAEGNQNGVNHPGGIIFGTRPPGAGSILRERMRIAEDGRVGIGTSTPNGFIDIVAPTGSISMFEGNMELQRNDPSWYPTAGGYIDFKRLVTDDYRVRIMYDHALNGGMGGLAIHANTNGNIPNGTGMARPMVVLPNMRIGMGTDTPRETLDVIGNIVATGTIYTTSDERYKKNIENITDASAKISKLNGVSYLMRTEEFPDQKFSDRRQLGVLAGEVEKVFPELVTTDDHGFRSVNYLGFIAPLIEAHKVVAKSCEKLEENEAKLQARVDDLESRMKSMQAMNLELIKRLEKLESAKPARR